jgi:hypothetical protein
VVIGFSPLRGRFLQLLASKRFNFSKAAFFFDRHKFSCYVELYTDESQPIRRDQFFRIQIAGRIPTEQANVDTDVQVEVLDITEGTSSPQQVLSTDENYRNNETSEFYLIQHNGIVPDKNDVLARRVTVANFPCHILRFAYRGRRKLLFCATIIEKHSRKKLVSGRNVIEYVYCSDGYREVHGRRLEVLQGCIELSAVVLGSPPYPEAVTNLWSGWIQNKTDMRLSVDDMAKVIEVIQSRFDAITIQHSAEVILAYGKNTDRFSAIELALKTVSLDGFVNSENLEKLFQMSEMLEIRQDRILSMTQKFLLSSNCRIESPSQLLGITPDMDDDTFRKRLNEEYRKWNSRVTNPDPEVRSQADQILTLIAEIRSQRLQSGSF